jgi:DeoR family transcriptional regulator of aga operon
MGSIPSIQNDNSTIDRRRGILELLNKNGQVKVGQLSKLFKVSVVTIRNDLTHLEEKGLLIKTRGGGIKTSPRVGIDYKLNEKSQIHSAEKQLIGKKAASIIEDNDIIIIDSGTTTLEIAKNLHSLNNLTVITNALNIASQLVDYENMRVILLGGLLRSTSLSLIGPISENSIKSFYCDKLFLGVDGIDSNYGITTPNPEEAHLNKLMIDISKQVIVVTDSSKFKRRSFVHIAPMTKIHTVITDSNIPEDELKNLQNYGVEVLII